MATFSISNYTSSSVTISVSGLTIGNTVRFFVRLTSDTSDATVDKEYTATDSTMSKTFSGLNAGISYTVNVHDGTAWIGAKTFTTDTDLTPSFEITEITDTSVTVSFYDLTVGDTIKGVVKLVSTDIVSGSFTATSRTATKTYSGLDPNTTYKFYMYQNGVQVDYYPFTTLAASTWWMSSSSLGTLSDSYSARHSFDTYELKRFSVVFATSGTATFYSTGSADTTGFLSRTTGYDEEGGEPTSYIVSDDDGGSGANFSFTYDVVAGTTYYLWVRVYDGATSAAAYICIDPPTALKAYIYNGSTWVPATPYIYSGSKWVPATPYIYSSGWK